VSIRVRSLDFAWGRHPLLRGLDLDIAPGGLTMLLGPNGCGKSTLLRLCAGLLLPARGSVEIDGKVIASMSNRERARAISWLPQFPVLPESFSVMECVLMGRATVSGALFFDSVADEWAAAKALARAGASELADRNPLTLSGGEYARVALARALVNDSPVLLLDEPGAHLDIGGAAVAYSLLQTIAQEGRTVLIAAHDIALARIYGESAILLGKNGVVAKGPVSEAINRETVSAAFDLSDPRALVAVGL